MHAHLRALPVAHAERALVADAVLGVGEFDCQVMGAEAVGPGSPVQPGPQGGIEGAQGRVVGLTAIGEDITERRIAEDEIRKLSQAIEQSPVSVMITDLAGSIEYVTPQFCRLTPYLGVGPFSVQPSFLTSRENLWTDL